MPKLTVDRVETIFKACLYTKEELPETGNPEDMVEVQGVMMHVGLNPERLSQHREEIRGMLLELPDGFMSSHGGGWSFLNACYDRHGVQWTGEHPAMELLFILGLATGIAKELLPRELWHTLPGSMPYYVIQDVGVVTETKPLTVNDLQGEAWLKIADGSDVMQELTRAIQVVTGILAEDVKAKISNFAVWNEVIYRMDIGRELPK